MPKRKAEARWDGSLENGKGTMRMASGSYEGPYSFQSRFQEGEGTNPEELIAAAHAGCFFDGAVGRARARRARRRKRRNHRGRTSRQGRRRLCHLRIELDTRARVPGVDADEFQRIAEAAKQGCPVSQALASVESIELNADLVG